MMKVEVYDKDYELIEVSRFEPQEIVALQRIGVRDEDIIALCPEPLEEFKAELAHLYGENAYARYIAMLGDARCRIERFWNRDTEDELIFLIRNNKCLYYVETTGKMTLAFQKAGAIPVTADMVKYLINDRFVVPGRNKNSYLNNEDYTDWKTLFAFPSLSVYESALSLLNLEIDYREPEITTIPSKYLNTIVDEQGVIYDETKRRLIYARHDTIKTSSYTIVNGCEWLDNLSFAYANIKHVNIPSSVKVIDDNVFLGSGITELIVPSVRLLGGCVCEHCSSLQRIVLPEHLEELQIASFNGCVTLSEVTLSKDLKCISDNCFTDCKSLDTLILPKTIRHIGGEAFQDSGIQHIFIPGSIQAIAKTAFLGISKDAVYLDAIPTPYNYPFELKAAHGKTADMFIGAWLNDLAGLYGIIRSTQEKCIRKSLQERTVTEMISYLDWMNDVVLGEFDEEMIEFCAYTMEPKTFSPVYLASIMVTKLIEVEIDYKQCDVLKYGEEFKQLLPSMYAAFDDRGCHQAVQDFVDNIGKKELSTEDPMTKTELELALNSIIDEDYCQVRMKSQFGYATDGPVAVVSKELIGHLFYTHNNTTQ